MTSIPLAVREALANDPWMTKCVHRYLKNPSPCEGRVEWDHSVFFRGRQVQEPFAIVPACYRHHRGGQLDRNLHTLFALQRATNKTLVAHSKAEDLLQKRAYLMKKYGKMLLPHTLDRVKLAPFQDV